MDTCSQMNKTDAFSFGQEWTHQLRDTHVDTWMAIREFWNEVISSQALIITADGMVDELDRLNPY